MKIKNKEKFNLNIRARSMLEQSDGSILLQDEEGESCSKR
jgi:hypothetical protein